MILRPPDVGWVQTPRRRSEAIAVSVSAAANLRVSIKGDAPFHHPDLKQ